MGLGRIFASLARSPYGWLAAVKRMEWLHTNQCLTASQTMAKVPGSIKV